MVRIDLKGIAKVRAKGRAYYYAWRGGPRLRGEPGSPEFVRSFHKAHENRRARDSRRFRSLVVLYKSSTEYKRLATTTKRNWSTWLDCIANYFGELRIAQFDRPEKIRPSIRRWRNKWADKPRSADYGLQVLSRVLSYAVDPLGKIAGNPCEGIKRLYSANRSEIIWTDDDIKQLKAGSPNRPCPQEICHAVDLAMYTGLRLSDLLRLSWSHLGEDAIIITTGKSKHRRRAIIPIYNALRDALSSIPKHSPTVLTMPVAVPGQRMALGLLSTGQKSPPAWRIVTCIFMICGGPPRRGSTLPESKCAKSQKSWPGMRSTLSGL